MFDKAKKIIVFGSDMVFSNVFNMLTEDRVDGHYQIHPAGHVVPGYHPLPPIAREKVINFYGKSISMTISKFKEESQKFDGVIVDLLDILYLEALRKEGFKKPAVGLISVYSDIDGMMAAGADECVYIGANIDRVKGGLLDALKKLIPE